MKNKIGILINYTRETDLAIEVRAAKELGASCCQLCFWDTSLYTDEVAGIIRNVTRDECFGVAALWAGWSGPCVWDFKSGPDTIGLVPKEYREARVEELLAASDFAKKIGVDKIITHVGFLPDDTESERFTGTVEALSSVVESCRKNGQQFLFEAGQEKPSTLLSAIKALGEDAVGVNLDMANLILYGMSSTLDAVEVIGDYVCCTHVKDGLYPTGDGRLGREVKAGLGMANIPEVIRRLSRSGYDGPFIIEREIKGEEQLADIRDTVALLNSIDA